MDERSLIATYYSGARELVKQKKPKEARKYVLALINYAFSQHKNAKTMIAKIRLEIFMCDWLEVSRELYSKGITDLVLERFQLLPKKELPKVTPAPVKKASPPKPKTPAPEKKEPAPPVTAADSVGEDKAAPEKEEAAMPPENPAPTPSAGGVNYDGLFENDSQGWCADIFDKYIGAIVKITLDNDTSISNGTGFIISEKGYLLTNDHVVFDDDNGTYNADIRMSLGDGKARYKIETLCSDKKADIALCRFDPAKVKNFSVVKRISDYSKVKPGADCLLIGNAFGLGLSPISGTIRFVHDQNGNLVFSAFSNPGDSGGPVFNRQGECIGVNKSKTTSYNHVAADGYINATPMDKVEALLDKWCKANDITL